MSSHRCARTASSGGGVRSSPGRPVAACRRAPRQHGEQSRHRSAPACAASHAASSSAAPGPEPDRQPGWLARDEGAAAPQLGAAFAGTLAAALSALAGGGGGPGGGEWGDGGGGGGGGGHHPVFELAEDDDDEEEEEDDDEEAGSSDDSEGEEGDEGDDWLPAGDDGRDLAPGEYFIDEVIAENFPEGDGVPSKEELFANLQCQPGYACNKDDVSADLRSFMNWNIFQDVQARVSDRSKDGKSRLVFTFVEHDMPPPKSVDVLPYKGSRLQLPAAEVEKVREICLGDGGRLDAQKMFKLREPIEKWYHSRGFTNCYVTHIEGMETGQLKVRVMEGKVGGVGIVQVDADGVPTGQPGNIPPHIVLREVPFKRGQLFSGDFLRKCLRDVFGLGLFESMSVNSKPSAKDDTKVDIELLVKERPVNTADLDLEWAVARSPSGRLGLASVMPGGSLTWEKGNIGGAGRQFTATATTANFFDPLDDIGYSLSYRHPDLRGRTDPRRTELNASVFNTRKLSPVFAAGPGKEDVPTMFVDRLGAKALVSERYSRNSKGSYGLVLEQVASLDETGALAPRGTKPLITGEYDGTGPPTSLSGSGKDTLAFLQSIFTRDTTHWVNGMQLGGRQVAQVDQGFGVGSGHPVFNRHRLSLTQFLPLSPVTKEGRAPPRVLVLHGRYGGCVGDQPPYELFTLGGPYSVRGYNMGELASTRYFVEGAAELRVPVKGRTVYAFAEGASDLGSAASVVGNPTRYFGRPGAGVSLGAGVRLGAARLECATEGLGRPSVLNIRFGERF